MGHHWFYGLIHRIFKKYWAIASAEHLQAAFGAGDNDAIAAKLTKMFARQASILGILTGVLMSAEEIVTFLTGAEGGLGLPFNIAVAALLLLAETFLLLRFQIALVAWLGKLYGVPLDPDNPEDILTILAFATGTSAANAAGTAGVKMGGKLATRIARTAVQKQALAAVTGMAERIGLTMLARAAVKYAIPVLSIGLGMIMNYSTTRGVGAVGQKHFKKTRKRMSRSGPGPMVRLHERGQAQTRGQQGHASSEPVPGEDPCRPRPPA